MTNLTGELFQSKYGYHPCSKETYLKLKYLKKMYWKTVRDLSKWIRWNKKTVYKSNIEPKYCDTFVNCKGKYFYYSPTKNYPNGRSLYCERYADDGGILELFNLAKTPQKEVIEPWSQEKIRKIDQLYEKVKSFVMD